MRKTLLTTTAIVAMGASVAFAEITNDAILAAYADYDRVEIKRGPTQVKVEAIRDGVKIEVIYDAASGAVLKQETEAVDSGDDSTPGVEIDTDDEDFLDDEDLDDDEEDDDDEDDDDEDDDDEGDDDEDDDHEDDDDEDDDDEDDDDEDDDDEDDDDEDDDEDDD